MLWAGPAADGGPGRAAWDLFRAEDSEDVRAFPFLPPHTLMPPNPDPRLHLRGHRRAEDAETDRCAAPRDARRVRPPTPFHSNPTDARGIARSTDRTFTWTRRSARACSRRRASSRGASGRSQARSSSSLRGTYSCSTPASVRADAGEKVRAPGLQLRRLHQDRERLCLDGERRSMLAGCGTLPFWIW